MGVDFRLNTAGEIPPWPVAFGQGSLFKGPSVRGVILARLMNT